jgi:hypothetical protein
MRDHLNDSWKDEIADSHAIVNHSYMTNIDYKMIMVSFDPEMLALRYKKGETLSGVFTGDYDECREIANIIDAEYHAYDIDPIYSSESLYFQCWDSERGLSCDGCWSNSTYVIQKEGYSPTWHLLMEETGGEYCGINVFTGTVDQCRAEAEKVEAEFHAHYINHQKQQAILSSVIAQINIGES